MDGRCRSRDHEVENKPALLKCAMLPSLALLPVTVLLALGRILAAWLLNVPQWHLGVLVALASFEGSVI